MLIESPCVVSLVWRLEDAQGELIDELDDPLEFFVGGDDLLAKIEQALLGQEAGFTTQLQLEPPEAYGDYDAALVFFEERALFPDDVGPGMQFEGPPPGATTEGLPENAIYAVTEVYDSHVVLDGNHPLAGMALRFTLVVHEVREATAQEIEVRSVDLPAVSVAAGGESQGFLH